MLNHSNQTEKSESNILLCSSCSDPEVLEILLEISYYWSFREIQDDDNLDKTEIKCITYSVFSTESGFSFF